MCESIKLVHILCFYINICSFSVQYRLLETAIATLALSDNFWLCFYAILYSSHLLTSMQKFTEIILGKPLRRRLNARGVAKYSDFGHVDVYL